MKIFKRKEEILRFIGTWDGGETGEIFDWLHANNHKWVVQADEDDLDVDHEDSTPDGSVKRQRKMLAIIGPSLWSHCTIEVGGGVALLENGRITEMYSGYLEDNFDEVVPSP